MIRQRDDMDRNRAVAPLKPAADAVIVDTSDLGIEGVLKVLTDTVAASSERIVREVRYCPKDAAEDAVSGMRDAAFSHMAGDGSISMVDVGSKNITRRVAIVRGAVEMNAHTLGLLKEHALPKGDVLVTAQVAGIMAAKRTSELIPLCHPVPLSFVDVRFEIQDEPPAVLIESEARTSDRTGVEMEAIIAAQVAAATIYDMCKAVQKDMVIRDVRLVHKSGGRTGHVRAPRVLRGADLIMLAYPNISPVALSLGPVQVHWYGLMYLFAFLAGWGLARWRASPSRVDCGGLEWAEGRRSVDVDHARRGGGGRLGYVLFYDLPVYLDQPSEIFKIWNGGMSFHGGLIGVLLMGWWWSRRNKKKFMDVVDFVAPLVPPGLFFGRIGNFINGELWGGVTDGPLGMVFPTGGPLPRHPSQLYEAGLEGLVLFVVLWVYSSRIRPTGRVSGLFAVLYGVFRFAVEFVRQPDPQLGYLAFGWLTMGQLLCVPLLIAGLWLLFRPVK